MGVPTSDSGDMPKMSFPEEPAVNVAQPPPAVSGKVARAPSPVGRPQADADASMAGCAGPTAGGGCATSTADAGTSVGSAGAGLAKPARSEYQRNLPHLQTEGGTYLVTFATKNRWALPEAVRDAVLRHCLYDSRRVQVLAAVVMPDHVHLLMHPLRDSAGEPFGLAEILNGIKGASAHTVNRLLGRKGAVWQDESFDHLLRSQEELASLAAYLCHNPVRRGLVADPCEYHWLYIAAEDVY